MQQGVGHPGLTSKVRHLAQQMCQWMPGRQCHERIGKIPDFPVGSSDPKPATVLLQHIDAGTAVGRIYHQVHGPIRFEDLAQSAQPGIRISEVMQHPCADDLVEALSQFMRSFDGKLVNLKIAQMVLTL